MPDLLALDKRPWLIAHRAANSLEGLAAARVAGAHLAECDLWSYRERYEVRHEKTLGRLPIRWDRWRLESIRAPHLDLDALLAAWEGPGGLLIDLKGRDTRLPAALLAALERRPAPVVACARRPEMLAALAAEGLPIFPSAGSMADLVRLERAGARPEWTGVSVHRKLLTPAVAERVRKIAPLIISWPINTRAVADQLLAIGIDGLISDNFALIAELAAERTGG